MYFRKTLKSHLTGSILSLSLSLSLPFNHGLHFFLLIVLLTVPYDPCDPPFTLQLCSLPLSLLHYNVHGSLAIYLAAPPFDPCGAD